MTNQSTELISRAKAGDEAAWQQLYAEYYPFIHHVACDILGDANAADDVASEVFLSLFEDKHILATRHSLVAFLRIKTHNLVIDVLRKDRTFQKLARLYHAVRDEVVMP